MKHPIGVPPVTPAPTSPARFARGVLSSGAVVAGAAGIYAIIDGRIVVALVALLALAGFLAARRLSPGQLTNVTLLAGVSVFTLYGVELGLALTSGPIAECRAARPWQILQCDAAHRQGQAFDTRTRVEVTADLENARNATVWPSIHPTEVGRRELNPGDSLMPLAGLPNVLTLYCNESGTWVDYQSDEHGFRNPAGVFDRPDDHAVILIGDSFTQGYCAPDGETIADYLRAAGHPVINLGSDGDGPLLKLATLKEFALGAGRLEPIVWLYFEGNDLVDLEREKEDRFLRRYLTESGFQRLAERQEDVDRLLLAWATNARRELEADALKVEPPPGPMTIAADFTFLRRLRALVSASLWRDEEAGPPIDAALFDQVLREAKRTTDAAGRSLAFVYLPEWSRFARRPFNPHRDEVTRIVSRLGIPVLDLTDIMGTKEDPLDLFANRANGHYSPAGYRVVAGAISDWLNAR